MKTRMKDLIQKCFSASRLFIPIGIVGFLVTSTTYASPSSCKDIFVDGVQSNTNGGYIRFDYNAKLIDSPTSVLYASDVLTNPWSQTKSCGNQHCIATGSAGPRLYGPPFKNTATTTTISVPSHKK